MTGKSIQSDLRAAIQDITDEHIRIAKNSFTADQLEVLEKISREVIRALVAGHKLLLCGNGGSAADAQHIAAELVGRFHRERKGLPAVALTTDSSILTAWSNDYDYSTVFERQVQALGKKGDVLLGISTSGNSDNVNKAVRKANEMGITTISLTGKDGGSLKTLSEMNIHVDSRNTARIQECHMLAYHIICELIDREFA